MVVHKQFLSGDGLTNIYIPLKLSNWSGLQGREKYWGEAEGHNFPNCSSKQWEIGDKV